MLVLLGKGTGDGARPGIGKLGWRHKCKASVFAEGGNTPAGVQCTIRHSIATKYHEPNWRPAVSVVDRKGRGLGRLIPQKHRKPANVASARVPVTPNKVTHTTASLRTTMRPQSGYEHHQRLHPDHPRHSCILTTFD
jgi:hypothetical protein